ncbi:hypothetical protein M422DRAFT_67955 [Sphaerobolus stellatus SS14]|uniref:BRCT domain-containing protein n=1 Tax=Sphaerobolus stellatus (strain SS14) TaxID=990650 RepID=A0A0C9VWU9_SPHS4|nr:hypothetical protein M422DRAFT_67955 [Sphaerobolus stellatus SS14]
MYTITGHIIASNLTPAKVFEFKNMKVVTPNWLLECKSGHYIALEKFRYRYSYKVGSLKAESYLPNPSRQLQIARPWHGQISRNRSRQLQLLHQTRRLLSIRLPPQNHQFPFDLSMAQILLRKNGQLALPFTLPINRILLRKRRWKTPVASCKHSHSTRFIEGFYENSRLHRLATWKSELQDLVAKVMENVANGEDEAQADVMVASRRYPLERA